MRINFILLHMCIFVLENIFSPILILAMNQHHFGKKSLIVKRSNIQLPLIIVQGDELDRMNSPLDISSIFRSNCDIDS